ncbi:MAG: hypothetical protein ABEK00_00210 [Candidatus Nanohaloarchaea archaeon]
MSDEYFDDEIRPRIDGDLAEEIIEDEDKSFRENLKEKLGLNNE